MANTIEKKIRRQAGRQGFLLYGAGAFLQMLVFGAVCLSVLYVKHRMMENQYHLGRDFLEFLDAADIKYFLASAAMGGIVYSLLSSLWGLWAGKAIQIKQSSHVGVGIFAMLLPSLGGALAMTAIYLSFSAQVIPIDKLTKPDRIFAGIGFLTAAFYLPGIVFGILSGLVVRQLGNHRSEKTSRQQSLNQ